MPDTPFQRCIVFLEKKNPLRSCRIQMQEPRLEPRAEQTTVKAQWRPRT